MDDVAPFDFDAVMSETVSAATSESTTGKQAGLTPVRYFTKAGIEQVEELLKTIRTDKTLHNDDVEALLEDPMYAKELAGDYKIDRSRTFATKLELCDYFIPLFGKDFLERNRKNAGLWTWLALAYYQQFVKTKKDVVSVTANARWIYDIDDFQNGRRHYIAGTLNLFLQTMSMSVGVQKMFFSAPPTEFSKLADVLTRVTIVAQSPAVLQVAGWLYYDPKTKKRFKVGAGVEGRKGSVFELARVVRQLGSTWDFFDLCAADLLWEKLPKQFDEFKVGGKNEL